MTEALGQSRGVDARSPSTLSRADSLGGGNGRGRAADPSRLGQGRRRIAGQPPTRASASAHISASLRRVSRAALTLARLIHADVDDMMPPSGLFVIARLDGDAIGCGGLKRVDKATGEIKRVWTAPPARGLGVARRMLRTLEAAAREKGLKTLRLDTNRG